MNKQILALTLMLVSGLYVQASQNNVSDGDLPPWESSLNEFLASPQGPYYQSPEERKNAINSGWGNEYADYLANTSGRGAAIRRSLANAGAATTGALSGVGSSISNSRVGQLAGSAYSATAERYGAAKTWVSSKSRDLWNALPSKEKLMSFAPTKETLQKVGIITAGVAITAGATYALYSKYQDSKAAMRAKFYTKDMKNKESVDFAFSLFPELYAIKDQGDCDKVLQKVIALNVKLQELANTTPAVDTLRSAIDSIRNAIKKYTAGNVNATLKDLTMISSTLASVTTKEVTLNKAVSKFRK